jgi:ABC-type glutathione transport system ATPase component
MTPLLEIQNLQVSFGKQTRAVSDLSFCVRKNSFTSLVGESGSGKTVTALSVCRLLSPEKLSGRVVYWDENGRKIDLHALKEPELESIRGRKIAMVFQDPASSLDPVMKIGRQVAEAYRAHFPCSKKEAHEKAAGTLRAVKLAAERVMESYPHELSGGMKQRAVMAMALVSGPRLLIADEPTTALDPKTEKEIMELLTELNTAHRLTVLFITHDLTLASKYSDEIVVLKDGRAVETMAGGSGRVYHPCEPYTQRLFKAQNWEMPPKSFIEV